MGTNCDWEGHFDLVEFIELNFDSKPIIELKTNDAYELIKEANPTNYQCIVINGALTIASEFIANAHMFDLSVPIIVNGTQDKNVKRYALAISKMINRGHILFDNVTTSFMLI